jgi:hypothetical protein
MWQNLSPVRYRTDVLTLQLQAERAGSALACPFSSSDEFEAAVISSKRRAGIYGPRRVRRHMLYVFGAIGVAAVTSLFV